MALATVEHLTFAYPGASEPALRDVSLALEPGEVVALLRPSGSGKTTLLRCIAGLERPDAGAIRIGDTTVYSRAQNLYVPPADRQLGMVFQSYAIWPHLTVFGNVALPLREGKRRYPKATIKEKVHRALALVGMQGLAERPAPLLSGGQQQRVALARALAVEPVLLLMDEPLSNLDARLREEVRGEIKALTERLGVAVVYVTHDQTEAMELADRVAVMHEGSILQIGPPEEVYSFPSNPSVAEFFGTVNWLEGQVRQNNVIQTALGALVSEDIWGFAEGDEVAVGVRPESLRVVPGSDGELQGENVFRCTIAAKAFLGTCRVYVLSAGNTSLLAMRTGVEKLDGPGYVQIPKSALRLFPRETLRAVNGFSSRESAPVVLAAPAD